MQLSVDPMKLEKNLQYKTKRKWNFVLAVIIIFYTKSN